MNIRDVELNLLIIFDKMIKFRSVSLVAEHLDMSQPAVSKALKRLRELLKDELFVRKSSEMYPTRYAQEIASQINSALNILQATLNITSTFDPSSAVQNF